jgi:hypothetical protein
MAAAMDAPLRSDLATPSTWAAGFEIAGATLFASPVGATRIDHIDYIDPTPSFHFI